MDIFRSLRGRQFWRRPLVQDAGVAAVFLCANFLQDKASDRLWWQATGLCLLAVALRRLWPFPALAMAMLGTLIHMAQAAGPTFVDFAAPIVLYTIARQARRKVSLALLALTVIFAGGWSLYVAWDGKVDQWAFGNVPVGEALAVLPGAASDLPPDQSSQELITQQLGPTAWGGLPLVGSLVAGWAVGSSAQSRRAYLDGLTARSKDLERERDQRDELAAAAERSRITRELHDVVAHGLSVIVMQAQGGLAALDSRPAGTRAALEKIVGKGRSSLADMRQVLAAVSVEPESTHPPPGLDRLSPLIDHVRAAGTPVELHVEGQPRPLPTAVNLAAYRIIQEGLTNTMKHAGPGSPRAEVVVEYSAGQLDIVVSDNGTKSPTPDSSGNGLHGMRERVALLQGELSAGPDPGGGFVVRARLPVGHDDGVNA